MEKSILANDIYFLFIGKKRKNVVFEQLYNAFIFFNDSYAFYVMLEAGFCLTNLMDDTDGYGFFHEYNVPTFIATRAVK